MALQSKDLLGIQTLSEGELRVVLDTAANFQTVAARPVKKVPALRGRTVANLFYEPSTRTRLSFELAAKRLSADFINITAASRGTIAPLNAAKGAFTMNAISEISNAQRGKRLLNRASMLYLTGSRKD